MKKRVFLSLFLLVFLAVCVSAADVYINDDYANCSGLFEKLNTSCGDYIYLNTSIDCTGINWSYGACYESSYFSGNFSGQNYGIGNLTINCSENNCGLFARGAANPRPNFFDFGLTDVDVNGNTNQNTGGLIGYIAGNISNCYVTGIINGTSSVGGFVGNDVLNVLNSYVRATIVSSNNDVAGLVGQNAGSIISSYFIGEVTATGSGRWAGGLVGDGADLVEKSYAIANVTGGNPVAGLVAANAGNIRKSYAKGIINGTDANTFTGGLVGSSAYNISDSYFFGVVEGNYIVGGLSGDASEVVNNSFMYGVVITRYAGGAYTGGLVGYGYGASPNNVVDNSFFVGNITYASATYLNAIVGYNEGGITNCYWDNTTSNPDVCSNTGVTSCTAVQDNSSYFKIKTNGPMDGWDFNDTWGISSLTNDGYPFLKEAEVIEPTVSNFEAGTTDFENTSDINNVANATLVKGSSSIQWNNTINANGADFDNTVVIETDYVSVDAANLDQSIDSPATVSITVDHCDYWEIYYLNRTAGSFDDLKINGTVVGTSTLGCSVQLPGDSQNYCSNVQCLATTLSYDVLHFDGTGGEGSEVAVPEFSSTTMLLAVLITIFGLIIIRRKNIK